MSVSTHEAAALMGHVHAAAGQEHLAAPQKLTPEEFTVAGDFLVRTYPTWSW